MSPGVLTSASTAGQVLAAGGHLGAGRPILGVVIGIVFAVIDGRIAASKGRSALLFGILGFFFSIITLVVVLLLPRKN